jgi:hypothetical protein
VPHGRFGSRIPQIRSDWTSGYSLKGRSRHELTCSRGHHHLYLSPLLAQATHEVWTFIGGDAPGHSEQYAFALH